MVIKFRPENFLRTAKYSTQLITPVSLPLLIWFALLTLCSKMAFNSSYKTRHDRGVSTEIVNDEGDTTLVEEESHQETHSESGFRSHFVDTKITKTT